MKLSNITIGGPAWLRRGWEGGRQPRQVLTSMPIHRAAPQQEPGRHWGWWFRGEKYPKTQKWGGSPYPKCWRQWCHAVSGRGQGQEWKPRLDHTGSLRPQGGAASPRLSCAPGVMGEAKQVIWGECTCDWRQAVMAQEAGAFPKTVDRALRVNASGAS